jgi:peptide/nickel transport system ATP-binding protein
MGDPLLSVEQLSVTYRTRAGELPAVRGVSFDIGVGEGLGLVGESGCGKSTVAYALMGYLGRTGRISEGSIRYRGRELASLSDRPRRDLWGGELAMIHQDPIGALNPVVRIGKQLIETARANARLTRGEAESRALAALDEVQFPDTMAALRRYPHELSGGQQQRIGIAMALIGRPKLLIMDEPTTGLDVTIEAAILELVAELRRRHDMALLYITHNLGTLPRVCDRAGVLYGGVMAETGSLAEVFGRPAHPYTHGLLDCLPDLETDHGARRLAPIAGRVPMPGEIDLGCPFAPRCDYAISECAMAHIPLQRVSDDHAVACIRLAELPPWAPAPPVAEAAVADFTAAAPLLRVRGLCKTFGGEDTLLSTLLGNDAPTPVVALRDVDVESAPGETLAIVGESGSGKSTLARILAGLDTADAGQATLRGEPIAQQPVNHRSGALRKSLQMVFQNPDSTLNPSHTVGFAITRALKCLSGSCTTAEVEALLEAVQLPAQLARRRPAHLSGGQKQRAAIARALAGEPALILADEPVSALDVSVQAAIVNLLADIQAERGMGMIFISHDLAVVRYLADRVAVLYGGMVMEAGPTDAVFQPPHHPYTQALLAAAPDLSRTQQDDQATPLPAASEGISQEGCPFHPRCPHKVGPICETQRPPRRTTAVGGHRIVCHIPIAELASLEPV